MTRNQLLDMENSHDSIYLNGHTYECSMYAIGSVIEACRAVIENRVKNAFAIVRPPGHHAETEHAMGFCVMNNVAIATRYCMTHLDTKKVMILDWTVNVPWPKEGMGDAEYIYAFEQVIMPIAREFAPSLVIVSAGFDAAHGDHIGQCEVTPAGYGQMTHMLMSLANGKVVMALEGGYNINSIAVSSVGCMAVLKGEAPEPIKPDSRPSEICKETIAIVKKLQATQWKSLA
ncbi:hypothetical protein PHYBLDRAFT_112735 [Phycomyces blakesleeanus NRRL 1555(-)]|uniref:histone deacetylase n=1 Tax=Phycomyces blakesleeanus (strain ATCC 8743b / DSM 1359 / FGSC 10004 / NBRC 33097 / NRRL 1555) TaxID=763407 RepID=A0A162U4W1_PHYB8|nr:hypothetical protein PHYBLDRAFT_112735 [Phycomyces blakesleeanus NRRL 1555(-)]OAD73442.1 hypothetical protein PHYBLDRAFT_112735 [Phycomyces blakesleeanus NRRL 1555(-)]|eukprot:XP_018291482.1 hypothetical protein PHYBLDRAFT_112735 [Phycomyces blakesleeanus NRRL 1555(-)]